MAIPSRPRPAWFDHPNFPAQALLLGSHQNFLAINDYLVEQASRVAEPHLLEGRYRRWISAMRSHERYEEHKLYPFLERRWPASGTDFMDCRRGHERLHEKHAAVLAAFQEMRDPDHDAPRDAARAELVRALSDHLATLSDHLRLEEDAVIPLLLELDREEFDAYCLESIDALLSAMDASD